MISKLFSAKPCHSPGNTVCDLERTGLSISQETVVFSVLLGQLNVVENKIEAIVLYYPQLATPKNSSQSDYIQENHYTHE